MSYDFTHLKELMTVNTQLITIKNSTFGLKRCN